MVFKIHIMINSDFHTHTNFSFDSKQDLKELILYSEKIGLKYLAITDHFENGSLYVPQGKELDVKKYFETISSNVDFAKKHNVELIVGIEVGYFREKNQENTDIINTYNFDYVINSVHEVEGKDCYTKEFFEGKDKHTSYNEYFNLILESIDAPYYYSTIGHIGYVERKAPYETKSFQYSEFSEILDEILLKIIRKDKILEINTSTEGLTEKMLPNLEVLKRYYELGGRLITFGSDAHSIARLGEKRDYVNNVLKEIGFEYLTLVKNRSYFQIKL